MTEEQQVQGKKKLKGKAAVDHLPPHPAHPHHRDPLHHPHPAPRLAVGVVRAAVIPTASPERILRKGKRKNNSKRKGKGRKSLNGRRTRK